MAIRRADAFDPARRLEPWLAGFLVNPAHITRRHELRRRPEALPEVESEDGGPVAAAERGELVAALRTRVDDLAVGAAAGAASAAVRQAPPDRTPSVR